MIIRGKATLKYFPKESVVPSFLRSPTATIFAEAPISVPFPQRQAPKARLHQRKCASIPSHV